MDSLSTQFPPQINLNNENKKELSKQIRAALEEHGLFVLKREEHKYFNDEMLVQLENLFSLSPERKAKNAMIGPYYKYVLPYIPPSESYPYYEALLTVNYKSMDEEAKKFTERMWPEGNEKFYQTICSTNKRLLELSQEIMDIIATGYDIENEGNVGFSNESSFFRMSKYTPPPPEKEKVELALPPHTDGVYLTILCQNEVNGLQVKSKDGNWVDVNYQKGDLLVFSGEFLKAWSNGKLKVPVHTVRIGGEKERYSYVFFLVPEDDEIVKPHSDFIGDENPARFKPFVYKEYCVYGALNSHREGYFEEYAGI